MVNSTYFFVMIQIDVLSTLPSSATSATECIGLLFFSTVLFSVGPHLLLLLSGMIVNGYHIRICMHHSGS